MLKRFLSFFAALTVCGFMATGCGSLQTAQGPNATAAELYSTIAEARAQGTILVTAGKISPDQAEKIRGELRTAQTGVDTYVSTGNADSLATARSLIAGARTFLIQHGGTFK